MEHPKCMVCQEDLTNQSSYDLMCSLTRYDDEGEPCKSMIEPDHTVIPNDYIVIGLNCCGHLVPKTWNRLLVSMEEQNE